MTEQAPSSRARASLTWARFAPAGSSIAERLAFFSIPEPNSGCYLWLGFIRTNGYPQIVVDGISLGAHRVALEQKLGRPLLPGEFACHKCDVRACVAEDHLFPGTHLDNMADMRAKGRGPHGERGGLAKLTEPQALAIRADPRPTPVIAQEYGVSSRAVRDIKRGVRWAHLGRTA